MLPKTGRLVPVQLSVVTGADETRSNCSASSARALVMVALWCAVPVEV